MAMSLAASFLVFAVIGRVMIQLYLTGNHGIRIADAKKQPIAAVAGATFVLSFAISLIIIGVEAINPDTSSAWSFPVMAHIGAFIGYTGILIVVVAQWQMRDAWRIGVDPEETTCLITTGLYLRSRNPIYFGIFLYWLGLCIIIPKLIICILALLCWLSIEVIVRRVEEPYLHLTHGKAFAEYKQRTNRYVIW